MEPGTFVVGCTAEGEPVTAETYRLPDRVASVWIDELAAWNRVPRLDAQSAAALWAAMRASGPTARGA
jgi:hypothetical protein